MLDIPNLPQRWQCCPLVLEASVRPASSGGVKRYTKALDCGHGDNRRQAESYAAKTGRSSAPCTSEHGSRCKKWKLGRWGLYEMCLTEVGGL